jgi:hypothetical protein
MSSKSRRGVGTPRSASAPPRLMARSEHASWHHVRVALLIAFVIVVVIVNVRFAIWAAVIETPLATDWGIIERGAAMAGSSQLYELRRTSTFVWSPVAAHALQVIEPLGVWLWRVILVAGALAMPTWRLRLLVLVSWPFWTDWGNGNLLTLIFLSAVYAWRGSRIGTLAFLAFALLIPRPLLAPMGLWILWKRPEWRWRFAGMFVVHALLVLWTGLGPEWIRTLLRVGPELTDSIYNYGPSRVLGAWWLVIGVPVGVWLFWRGRVGWAGLAISPYVWAYYLFWLLPEVNRRQVIRNQSQATHDRPQARMDADGHRPRAAGD